MRVLIVVIGLAAVVVAAQADYSAAPVTTPFWLGEPAANTNPPHWIPKQPGHYSKTDWQHVIDSTWGPGLPVNQKLAIFDLFWNTIDDSFACFNNLTVNWDSLRSVYRPKISRGRFAAIMKHLAIALREAHTSISDIAINRTRLLPGVPVWVVGGWYWDNHFGAGLTPLPDSSLLVYRVVPSHPLGLVPGDVVLGYDRRRWTDILRELQEAQLPIVQYSAWGSCSTAMTHSLLNAAGMNWHLFDTIDIAKYWSGETLHLPTLTLRNLMGKLFETEQLDVPGVPMPAPDSTLSVSYGVVSGTRIGYIYGWRWQYNAAAEFYNAVNALVSDATLKGIIIDFRYNQGGYPLMSDSGLELLFRDSVATMCQSHRRDSSDHYAMTVFEPASAYVIPGNGVGYDKPIAVLVGPGAVSAGDMTAYRITYHPRVKTFGKSTNAAFNWWTPMSMPIDWDAPYAGGEACLASDTTYFLTHRESPVDVPVWLTRDAVAHREDNVVTTAIAWIDSSSSVAVEETPSDEVRTANAASVVRGVLFLPEASSHKPQAASWLLDISGRKVLDLLPGPNDVRALAPGVYFVREASGVRREASRVRKVVVTH
jgi:hypothetical protein